jgi:APA family basic amino acid/polyamine antiporter
LAVCTVLYIVVSAILNGMVPFYTLNVAFPVAFAVNSVGLAWAGVIVSFGAIAGLTTVMLVQMYAQTRIFYAMSRDGLIPPRFTALHPTWRTPMFSQIFFGILIAAAGALFPIDILGSLTNMGTLCAFVLVSAAVPLLRRRHPELKGLFKLPFGPYVIPGLSAISALFLIEPKPPAERVYLHLQRVNGATHRGSSPAGCSLARRSIRALQLRGAMLRLRAGDRSDRAAGYECSAVGSSPIADWR